MTHEHIAMVALLIAQALTIALLCSTKKESDHWRTMWTRDATELLHWKRNALMRDPKTGRYKRKSDF